MTSDGKPHWLKFEEGGRMLTVWYQIGNLWYYFYPPGSTADTFGYMAVNTRIGDDQVGADGAWTGQ